MSIMVWHRVSLETIVIIFVNGIVLTVLPCSLLPGALFLSFLWLSSFRSPSCLPFALSLPSCIVKLRQTIHLQSIVVVFKIILVVVVELVVVVTIGWFILIEVVFIERILRLLCQGPVLSFRVGIRLLFMELMALLRVAVVFLPVDVGLGVRCLHWVVLSVLLVSSILRVCDLWQGVLGVRSSAAICLVVWLSSVQAMGVLWAITCGMMGLCMGADMALMLRCMVSLTVLHKVSL